MRYAPLQGEPSYFMKKLFIVDALNFLFRAYYAIGPMTNPKGESTNALYGFIRSVFKIIDDFSPDYIVIVFDGPDNKKSRTDIYAEYKSHRKSMPEDLFPQVEKALLFCELAGLPFLSLPGVEADDTIGSIARFAKEMNVDTYICSSDKDLCQLVTDHVFVIHPHKDNLCIDKHKVKELFGVHPEQMIDYLAIVGDASDNIPGLEGFGPKTACTLLSEFGSLDNLLKHPEKLSGKKQETLIQGKDIALLSQKLATIHTGLDIPTATEFYHIKYPDVEHVKVFYQEMHFLSLLKELDTVKGTEHKKEVLQEEPLSYAVVEEEESLKELILLLKEAKDICIDTETTNLHPMLAKMVGIGFSCKPAEAWYVPLNGKVGRENVLHALKDLFSDPSLRVTGHNLKYDFHVLSNEGLPLPKIGFDTIIASYLLSPQNTRHNLDSLSLEKFGKVKIPIEDLIGKGKKQISMNDVPIDKVEKYCCEDVDYTLRLKELFEKELRERELTSVFATIELPLIPVLLQMERYGIFVDTEQLELMSKELGRKIHHLEEAIYALAGEMFNINSPKQLSVILFEKLGLTPPKKTQTGFSTAAEVLESLQGSSPIIEKLLEYRLLEKLRSTYVDALPNEINPSTLRIHCNFSQTTAATGRLASQNPNLQNIPVRTEEGKKIREAFRPESFHFYFLSADYSQIELRLLAHLSEDPALIQAFQAGEDIHTYTASLVFDVPLHQVTPQMRHRAKTVNFGIIYGQQAFGLSQELSISYQEASSFIETYFKRYSKVKEYVEFCKESARHTGKATTLTGRQRPLPEIHSKNPMIRSAAERLAVNTPLQGTAADLIKLAMIQVDHFLDKNPLNAHLLLQIHDELLFEVHQDDIDLLSHKVKNIMENVFTLRVPLIVDISIGKNWGEC